MIMTNLEKNTIQGLLERNISYLDTFEQKNVFGEKTRKFWFEYNDGSGKFPFELLVKVGRNISDEEDKTPVVEFGFSTAMEKNGLVLRPKNDLLKEPKRKRDIRNFYFKFEEVLLNQLKKQSVPFGYDRFDFTGLFNDFEWFKEGKAVVLTGRKEKVKNLSYEQSRLWSSEEAYKDETLFAEGKNARHFIRYFLGENKCTKIVKEFLQYVLNSGKEVRIVDDTTFWNYHFVIRPDMLGEDYRTLEKLGYKIQFNNRDYEEQLTAMKYIFELFSTDGVVNLSMDEVTVKEINSKRVNFLDDPFSALISIQEDLENLKTKKDNSEKYQIFQEKYYTFLDGLLDLYIKYKSSNDEKYKKRSERVKLLWLKYVK